MRLCLACGSDLNGPGWQCQACGHEPTSVYGFPAFAPRLSDKISGFNPDDFADLERLEAGSFWFKARNALILGALRNYALEADNLLEIGCGTGYVLSAIAESLPHLRLTGSELHASGLKIANSRLESRAELLQLDARHLPFREEFRLIGVFDVLEHIDEDEAVLGAIHAALRAGGIVLATVPQHPSLWSPNDEVAQHVRRYKVGELDRKICEAGFVIRQSTSFVTLLLPAMAISRMVSRRSKTFDPEREMELGDQANRIANFVMNLERWMIDAGVSFPVGGSRFVVAEKTV